MEIYPIEQYVDLDPSAMNILIFVVDKCNYRCEYCYNRFPRTLKSADLNLFSKFIKDIKVKTNRKLNISLIGGEPTLNPNIHSFIENVKELENVTVELLTNLSQPLEYYIKCLKNDVKIAASWHSNQKDKNNLDYVKKIMEIPYEYYEKNMIEVRIMFEYENWSSSDMVYNLLFNKYKKWMEISLLTKNDGSIYPYTEEQIQKYHEYVKKLKYMRDFFTLVYSDGSKKQVSFNDMYLNSSVNFQLWKCNAGLDYIYIHVDGNVFNCQSYYEHGMKPICNIHETNGEYKKELFKPCICRVDYCSCDFDVHKEKVLKGLKR